MTLSADDPGDLDHAEIEVLRQPSGGTLDVELETGAHTSIATAAPAPQAVWLPVPSAPGQPHADAARARRRAGGRAGLERHARPARRDLRQPRHRGRRRRSDGRLGPSGCCARISRICAPSLIVLAFGTNEGFRDSTDPAAYATVFADRLRALHAAAPGAALLVLGPPDAYRHRRKGSSAPPACDDPNWTEPAEPRADPRGAAQHRRARRARISGTGRRRWAGRAACCAGPRPDPPMAAPDRVHLFAPGYQATADALFRAIMDGYERYRALRPAA